MRPFLCAAILCVPLLPLLAADPPAKESADFAQALAGLAAKIAPSDAERETLRQTLGNSLREEIRAANRLSTAEWKKLASADDWQRFSREKIAVLRQSLNLPSRPAKPELLQTGQIQGEGFTICNVCYVSRPGLVVTANLYVPDPPRPSMPGILLSHSHHNPKWEGELQDMGMTWARAGCYVLVPDHLGHGERRQHPFVTAADYEKEFAVSRQDYNFRYDTSLQLYLAGESLMGWLVHDLMTGVDLLLAQPGIDSKRIALLGAVAGGGDPAAATAAVDERITCVVPFNFGGPQPETRIAATDDPELAFNYAGGGSWESTRNIAHSAGDGFLPWVIVGSVSPRYLIHAHEFQWDETRDPVWKRYQQIYQWLGQPDRLSFTRGHGTLTSKDPVGSHCNNIGPVHRKAIHEAFRKWFAIEVNSDAEYKNRRTREELTCLTTAAREKLKPQALCDLLAAQAKSQLEVARKTASAGANIRWQSLQKAWAAAAAHLPAEEWQVASVPLADLDLGKPLECRRIELRRGAGAAGSSTVARALLIRRKDQQASRQPVVVAIASDGAAGFLKHRSQELAELLTGGATVALVEVAGTGVFAPGNDHGQFSSETSYAATQLMLGQPLLARQLSELTHVVRSLRVQPTVDASRIYLWGDSFADPLATDANFKYPRRIDRPSECEPAGPILALLLANFDKEIAGVYAHGSLVSYASVLESPFVQVPHACIVPGILRDGDLPDLVGCLAPRTVILEGLVDGRNRRIEDTPAQAAYAVAQLAYGQAADRSLVIRSQRTSPQALLRITGLPSGEQSPLKIHLIGVGEYDAAKSMAGFQKHLEQHYRVACTASLGGDGKSLANLDSLQGADVLVIFARRMNLPAEQMAILRAHWEQGKPIVAMRTASHAFQPDDNAIFDKQVLGGSYRGSGSYTAPFKAIVSSDQAEHPVVRGVKLIASRGYYGNDKLADDAIVLQVVESEKKTPLPVTWTHSYQGGRTVYTSLGTPEDFQNENFLRLLVNSIYWTSQREPAPIRTGN